MGALNFIWDLDQDSRINKLEERIEQLEKQNKILYEWILYFKQKLEVEE